MDNNLIQKIQAVKSYAVGKGALTTLVVGQTINVTIPQHSTSSSTSYTFSGISTLEDKIVICTRNDTLSLKNYSYTVSASTITIQAERATSLATATYTFKVKVKENNTESITIDKSHLGEIPIICADGKIAASGYKIDSLPGGGGGGGGSSIEEYIKTATVSADNRSLSLVLMTSSGSSTVGLANLALTNSANSFTGAQNFNNNAAITAEGYITGTWLQTTGVDDLGSSPNIYPVFRDDKWIYSRTKSEMISDLGIANQKIKVGSTTFASNAEINLVASDNISITPNTSNNSISIAATVPTIDIPRNQMGFAIIVNLLTNINGRVFQNYTTQDITIAGYSAKKILYNSQTCTEAEAKTYLRYMTGSEFLPKYNYDYPQNTLMVDADGLIWKPQYDSSNGLVIFDIEVPYPREAISVQELLTSFD